MVQINEIIVGHAGDIVHHKLVGLRHFVGYGTGIGGQVYIINMMLENGGILALVEQIVQKLLINIRHHGLGHPLQLDTAGLVFIDDGVIFPLAGLHRLEMLLIQLDIGLAVAVFDDVDHQIVDDLGIHGANHGAAEGILLHHLNPLRVLTVPAQIGDDVGNAYHITLQSGRLNLVGIALDGVALFQLRLELLEAFHGNGAVLLQLDFAVVTGDAHQSLQAQIQGEHLIQHPNGVDVVIKVPTGVVVVQFVQKHLAGVGKGGMADIVTQGDGLNQIQIQIQRAADGSGDTGHQLNVQASSGHVIVLHQREDLSLIGVTVVVGAVQDTVNILSKSGAPDRSFRSIAVAANRRFIRTGPINKGMVPFFLLHLLRKLSGQFFFRHL